MTVPPKPPIAANLRELKASRGCTVRDIALAVDVGERSVQMWLSDDDVDPSWANLCKLAEFFDVRPAHFYEFETVGPVLDAA